MENNRSYQLTFNPPIVTMGPLIALLITIEKALNDPVCTIVILQFFEPTTP
jgi:hypothetical protein